MLTSAQPPPEGLVGSGGAVSSQNADKQQNHQPTMTCRESGSCRKQLDAVSPALVVK